MDSMEDVSKDWELQRRGGFSNQDKRRPEQDVLLYEGRSGTIHPKLEHVG